MSGLIPLYDKIGTPYGFKVTDQDRILAFSGASAAWIQLDSVYTYAGQHVGWWEDDCIRGHDGGVIVFAEGAVLPGLHLPRLFKGFSLPAIAPEAARNFTQLPPDQPLYLPLWSSAMFGVWT